MRIAHVYKGYPPLPGGIESYVRAVAEAQSGMGHEVSVLCCADSVSGPGRDPSGTVVNGVAVRRFGTLGTIRSMPVSPALYAAVSRLEADVVHVHSPFPLGEAAARAISPRNGAVAVTHHSDVIRQKLLLRLYAPAYRRFLARANAIIATSEKYIESSPWLQPVRDKCVAVPIGIDAGKFGPVADRAVRLAQKFAGGEAGIRLLFVGRFRHYKGVGDLIEAMRLLPQSFRLDIVGDGALAQKLRERANSMQAPPGRISFLGEIDDDAVIRAYRDADLLVLPCTNRAEAFGTVLLEAMAANLPCVTCEVGTGTSFIVQDGVTGAVARPSDPPALAEAIRAVCASPEKMSRMGDAGRGRVERFFSLSAMLSGIEDAYTAAIERNAANTKQA